ncbi:SHOCT domain-containing protein [Mycolicibacterium tusciae]|uniref:SHOCT domain-containing protein n=1 Tax=Mycolicibacterium tusciae TaxID=75922 RepID=UPI00024A3EED|nr:SHOCT domain-containing protein [Mycolicibacterium tusciae]
MGGAGMGGWWVVWPLLVLMGVLLLGYLVYRLAASRSGGQSPGGVSSARRILDERYARGEIDDQEYRQRRSELG